jgi:hypothetical protein
MLNQVLVRSVRTNDLWLVPISQWFDKGSGDGYIVSSFDLLSILAPLFVIVSHL